jgi:Ni/Co efflux regulator RcnB
MKRIIVGLIAAAVLALPSTAAAAPGTAQCSTPSGHPLGAVTWKNPGEMFRDARSGFGLNPVQLAGAHGATVGQFVQLACRS